MSFKKFLNKFIKFSTKDNKKGVGRVYQTEDDIKTIEVACALEDGWTDHFPISNLKDIEILECMK